MIGITFAVRSESSELISRLRERQRRDNLVSGKIDEREVTIVHTGVGAKYCNERLEILLHKTRPKLVISSGFAGAVSDELEVGDLILAENFSDPELIATAVRVLASRQPRREKLFTSTSIIDSIAERNEIARAADAAAVDMETGAIVAACKAHGVPLLSLRAISDTARDRFPAPPSVLFDLQSQRTNWPGLISYLMGNPIAIWRLSQFSRQIKRVRTTLTDAIVELVRAL
jgi:adenosylhomocysteine nucleosidase